MHSHRQSPRVSIYWLIPVCILSAAVGGYLAITLTTANIAGWGQWLRNFAQSPGAAASAALVAALIAFTGISRQVSVSRASLDHQRQAARTDAWWAMFEWASDRAIPPRNEDQPLPTGVTISTLERLAESATSSVQEAACAGIIDVLIQNFRIPAAEPPQHGVHVTAPEPDDSTFAALASYVESSRGTSASSAVAEALVYENNVMKALLSLAQETPAVKIIRNPPSDSGIDAIAEVDGQRVVIVIKFSHSVERLRFAALKTVRRLRSRDPETIDACLLITPLSSPWGPDSDIELHAVATQWREPTDTPSLLPALRRAIEMK